MKKLLYVCAALIWAQVASTAATLLWAPSTGNWDTVTTNWLDTNLSTTVAFAPGDGVILDDSGSAFPLLTVVGTLTPGSVVVDASVDYTVFSTAGALTGAGSLTKRGNGRLALDATNTITGPTMIEGGTLQLGTGANRGALGTGPLTNLGTFVINRTGTLNFTNNLSGPGAFNVISSGTVNIRGTNDLTGAIFHSAAVLNFTGASTIGSPSDITISAASNNCRLQISGGVSLTCPVKMFDATGNTTVRAALQSMDGTNSSSGPIYVGPGSGSLVQLMAMNAGSEFRVNSSVSDYDIVPYSGPFYLRGTIGSGSLYGTINLPSASLIKTDNGIWTLYSTGNTNTGVLIAQGVLRLGVNNPLPNVACTIGQASPATRAVLDLGGYNQQLTTLNTPNAAGAMTNIIANSSTTADSILTLSGGGFYGGFIQDSISNGTRKVGITLLSGAQQFTNVCTYSGPTSIAGGGLALVGAGTISNSTPISIADGAALDVSFRADGGIVLQPAQTLKGDGSFQVVGNLTNLGIIELKANKIGSTLSSDSIRSLNHIAYGGTLQIVLSGDTLTAGDSFKLFNATNYSGAFSNIVPTTPAAGLAWNTSSLTIDGTISVGSAVNATPTNITAAVVAGGTQIQLSWPADYTGWTLQAQTNVLTTGLSGNWVDLPASTTTNQVFLPIDKSNPTVFYRLRLQQ